jgi:2-methylisocitrate lyase-like PEP mutase family enzyme
LEDRVETGDAGLSIEDATGDAAQPLYELGTAVERIRAARVAIDKAGADPLIGWASELTMNNIAAFGVRPSTRGRQT